MQMLLERLQPYVLTEEIRSSAGTYSLTQESKRQAHGVSISDIQICLNGLWLEAKMQIMEVAIQQCYSRQPTRSLSLQVQERLCISMASILSFQD